ncbi:MAG TPA: hypothetical protein VFR25_01920 [Candidatus Eisenbacteria bacterium]|nr:hypothetical protein [Candidatus Eisenbacteria bacterium]
MRPELRPVVLMAGLVCALAAAPRARAQSTAPRDSTSHAIAPVDSTRHSVSAAPHDSLALRAARRDSLRAVAAVRDSIRFARALQDSARSVLARRDSIWADRAGIQFEEQRKRGEITLEHAWVGRRGAILRGLPLAGIPVGTLSVPDAGSPIRTEPPGSEGIAATDRPLVSAMPFGVGIVDLPVALDSPRAEGDEPLDLVEVEAVPAPGSYRRAGELLADPAAEQVFVHAMPGTDAHYRRARSALYYGNGDEGELDTAARFASATFGWGIAGSYARHEADGLAPLHHAKATRYAVASGLPRALHHTLWIEARAMEWNIEDEAIGIDPINGTPFSAVGRAEISRRDVLLHGQAGGSNASSVWTAQLEELKRTRVEGTGARQRWIFPGVQATWDGHVDLDRQWSVLAHAEGSSRRIRYDENAAPIVDGRREEGRLGLALAHADAGGGSRLDVAYDARETAPSFADARASLWTERGRMRGRIDLERSHERPSWVDLATPASTTERLDPTFTQRLILTRSGDPSLEPRRLTGGLARGALELGPNLAVTLEGSARYVEDDFGWTLTRVATPETLLVDTRAAVRGSGWVSYLGSGFRARTGSARWRAFGWVRGGPDDLGPRSGLVPRMGADVAADFRVTFFEGDLPLELGVRGHALGPSHGTIEAAGSFTADLALRADFGPAGGFLEMMNVFDRAVPSSVMELSTGEAAPLPGRAFHLGLVWYLFD